MIGEIENEKYYNLVLGGKVLGSISVYPWETLEDRYPYSYGHDFFAEDYECEDGEDVCRAIPVSTWDASANYMHDEDIIDVFALAIPCLRVALPGRRTIVRHYSRWGEAIRAAEAFWDSLSAEMKEMVRAGKKAGYGYVTSEVALYSGHSGELVRDMSKSWSVGAVCICVDWYGRREDDDVGKYLPICHAGANLDDQRIGVRGLASKYGLGYFMSKRRPGKSRIVIEEIPEEEFDPDLFIPHCDIGTLLVQFPQMWYDQYRTEMYRQIIIKMETKDDGKSQNDVS